MKWDIFLDYELLLANSQKQFSSSFKSNIKKTYLQTHELHTDTICAANLPVSNKNVLCKI